MTGVPAITSFSGKYRFLSNFYPVQVSYQGDWYPSVEHGFQAAKTDSSESRLWIKKAPTAAVAKQRGRRVTLREDWELVKDDVMSGLLTHKFSYPAFRVLLIATGSARLVEGNTWGDVYWGECPLGTGQNKLGELLMQVRAELHKELP